MPWDDPDDRRGILGGAFVSVWMVCAYVAIPYATGRIVDDAFFLVEAAMRFFEVSIGYHVAGLVVPGFLATVSALVGRRGLGADEIAARARIVGGVVLVPVVAPWILMVLWVAVLTVGLLVPSDPGITVWTALSAEVLFLFGGTFLALFMTPVVLAGVGFGTGLGYAVVAVGERLLDRRRSRPDV